MCLETEGVFLDDVTQQSLCALMCVFSLLGLVVCVELQTVGLPDVSAHTCESLSEQISNDETRI